ncbi:hypothetical protein DSM110093_03741 (plasmid) [Sulfitobacter sp. DSM 110093]|uniref:DUF3131 domain-containing protein n=1 Tax=Sulfitobacter sp. DSM 110093 TaxID=2883127 RepID=UPI001FAD1EFA|nr:DUF3131 domain-containing protein [Sulfitobacter sp. DSM 110093]UOA33906.1 hypothetical protein DSM110093_03741 [Sulfitobacter sp. DSM 110093]
MIGRRTFLKWGTTAPVFFSQQTLARAASAIPQNTIVVIDGFDRSADPERAALVLDAFARAGLPVTCVVDLGPTSQEALAPQSAVSTMLKERLIKTPGLIEVVPLVKDLSRMSPYFQARAVHDAIQALHNGFGGSTDGAPQTIACDMRDRSVAPSGVRASGIRTVLARPFVSAPVRPEAWEDGVVRMVGGQRVRLKSAQNAALFYPRQAVERVLYLSAQDFLDHPLARVAQAATTFALQVLQQQGDYWVSPILAADIQFRDAYAYKRLMGVHFVLEARATSQDQAAVRAFRRELSGAGVPTSFGNDPTSDPQSGYWIGLGGAELTKDVAHFRFSEGGVGPRVQSTPHEGYGIAAALSERDRVGLTAQNVLNVPVIAIDDPKMLINASGFSFGTADCVLAISAGLLGNRAYRNALKDLLYQVLDDGITDVVSLPEYVRRLVPTGPYLTHFRRTQAYQHDALHPPEHRHTEREQLLADAKVAWSYFERWTNPETGLCPATVNFAPGQRRLHEAVTMWDVGSHIFALMAAVDLELIAPQGFQSAIRRILPNIAGRRSQGRHLPQGWIATDRFKWGNKNFDGCDAGRLLAALYNLDMHPLVQEKSAPTVASWDLEAIVADGIIHSVEEGKLASTFRSHCAHYAAWAFRTWGIDVNSPYEVLRGASQSDGQMALLEVGGHIGPMGAEPLLMEALEFGMSPESAYLADVLFAAQLEEHDETGRLICVSEGPINSPPWFLYQGLQFDAPGRVWATDTVDSLPEHRTNAFRDAHLSISSKGAFLWSAYRDHPFCDKLRALVRDRAKTPYGFASSINERAGQASTTYSDINTNAVILQSIAHMLKTEA